MIDPGQFRSYVIDPTLRQISLYSLAASNLLLGTALTESGLVYLHQVGGGPALGPYQMEPPTAHDILANYLPSHPALLEKIQGLQALGQTVEQSLICNLAYATAMCRAHYLRVPAALPDATDAQGLAEYWKLYFNTPLGAGTVERALPHFQAAIATA